MSVEALAAHDRNVHKKIGGFRMKRFSILLFVAFIFMTFSGCSSRAFYESLREIERQNCYELESMSERQECLDRVDETSYDQYQKEREEAQKQ